MSISSKTNICMVIGDPIEHSLSPQIHNAGYKALGIDHNFVYVAARVEIERIKEAVNGIRALGIRGVSCTMPHKLKVMGLLDRIDSVAQRIDAVNTIVNDRGKLTGYNTDWLGAIVPLERRMNLNNKKVAVIGAGGAARAIVYGLTQKKADVTIYNRTLKKARVLAQEFGCKAESFNNLTAVEHTDVIINATPIGMGDNNSSPVPREFIHNNHTVFDAIYIPYKTRLLRDAREKGAKIIHGYEMLLHQATAQFRLYTGHDAPEKVMAEILIKKAEGGDL